MEGSCQTEIRSEILPLEMLLALTSEMKGTEYAFPSTSLGRLFRYRISLQKKAWSRSIFGVKPERCRQLSAWLISSQFVNPQSGMPSHHKVTPPQKSVILGGLHSNLHFPKCETKYFLISNSSQTTACKRDVLRQDRHVCFDISIRTERCPAQKEMFRRKP